MRYLFTCGDSFSTNLVCGTMWWRSQFSGHATGWTTERS